MKKNRIYIGIAILLAVIAIVFFYNNKKSTLREELSDFAFKDTASITKIFMVNKNNRSVTLERKDGSWIVNGKYKTRKDAIDGLLSTICRVEVKAPVPKSAFETVVKNLATNSVKIEIYRGDNCIKTYYVGDATQDHYGTYMCLENSTIPFITHVPGFFGFLTPRYFIDEVSWRSTNLFSHQLKEIACASVEYPDFPEKSFKITSKGDNAFNVISLTTNKTLTPYDTIAVMEFMGSFRRLNFEAYTDRMPQSRKDSVIATKPLHIITVEDRNGTKQIVKTYIRPNTGTLLDDKGKPFSYDPDRMYALIEPNELVIVQYYVFDPILKELNNFYYSRDKKQGD